MLSNYFYDGALRTYLLQFCNIFAGMQVATGRGQCGEVEMMSVPITIGSRDRVAAAIAAGNTQNRPFSLPIMAATMNGLALAPTRKGVGTVDSRVYLPQGGVYPQDLKTVVRYMPIPYMMNVELAIYASNTDQLHQILEQILMLFDPVLQLQKSDSAFDWTKITSVELVGINNQENFPPAGDRRVLNWSLNFDVPIYISPPANIKDEMVKKVIVTIGDLDGFSINEFDEDGNMLPFSNSSKYGSVVVDSGT